MKTRFAIVSAVAIAVTLMAARAPRPLRDIDERTIEEAWTALTQDSMEQRATGSRGLDRATAFMVADLTRSGAHPAGDAGTYLQSVPLVRRQLDLAHARSTDNGLYIPGVDFLPLVGAFGLGTPNSVNITRRTYVPAGQLGAADAANPASVAGNFPVFLAPRRSNGQPDYQLWDQRETIARYRSSAAIFVAILDLMPRTVIDAISAPRIELRDRVAAPPSMPPVIAITRGASSKGTGSVNRALSYTSTEAPVVAHNIVAVVEGSDARLKSQYVVLSAHADADATGAAALIALARHFANESAKPKRSLIFVWTTGSAEGLLGAEYFADRPTIARDSIVAHIAVDRVARGPMVATGGATLSSTFGRAVDAVSITPDFVRGAQMPRVCDGDHWHFARWGIPSVRVSSAGSAETSAAVEFAALARVTAVIADLAQRTANDTERPVVDRPKPDPRTLCAR